MITLEEVLERLHVVSLPLHTSFRGVNERECALFEGPEGWGEFSAFLEYEPSEARHWLDAAVEAASTPIEASVRSTVPVNATIPAVSASEVASVLARYDGCTTAKVKVAERGGSLHHDRERVRAVRELLGDAGQIRVDANGGWTKEEAVEAITALSADGPLEYVEQPCLALDDMAYIRERFRGEVLIAADESIRKADDPFRVRDAHAADVAVIKVAPLGGVTRALKIASELEMPVVVSSELSSSVGLGMGSLLAGLLPDLPYACGLATADLLIADVTTAPISPRAGVISVGRVTPDPELLARYAVGPARLEWWRERVRACWTAT